MGIETEIKFEVSPSDLQKLAVSRSLQPSDGQLVRHRHLISTYFDTPNTPSSATASRSACGRRARNASRPSRPPPTASPSSAANGRSASTATSRTCAPRAARRCSGCFQSACAASSMLSSQPTSTARWCRCGRATVALNSRLTKGISAPGSIPPRWRRSNSNSRAARSATSSRPRARWRSLCRRGSR